MSLTDWFRYQMILTANYILHYVVIMYTPLQNKQTKKQ